MKDDANALAPNFFQVSYVVRDMDAAQEWFKRVLGVRHFGTFETFLGPDFKFRMRGRAHPGIKIKVAMARLGAGGRYELELIEPERSDNIYNEFLEQHGPGLHHVAYVVPDFDKAVAPVLAAGMQPLIEFENPGTRGAYFDLRPAGASIIEVVEYNKQAASGLDALKGPRADGGADSGTLAEHFFQVAYLARDFRPVVDFFKDTLGVERFAELNVSMGPPEDIKVKGRRVESPFRLKAALGPIGRNGENEFELIAPLDPNNIYQEMVEERGPGIHHISCKVPDYDRFAEHMRANGLKPVLELDLPIFKGAYFDCRSAGASYIQVGEYREERK
jgi:methylmalonyl-CoA/ethylmalonyl-CoA epimerase